MLLLFAVVWSRVWASVPQTVAHDHAHGEEWSIVSDACGDEWTIAAHAGDQDMSVAAAHADNDAHTKNDQHHHHLHLCSMGGSALIGQFELQLLAEKSAMPDSTALVTVIRRQERLLRPPRN